MGMFERIMTGLQRRHLITRQSLSTNLSQSALHGLKLAIRKGVRDRLIGQTKGGMKTKLHAVTDTIGRPIWFFLTAGQISGYHRCKPSCCRLVLGRPRINANWFREAPVDKGITPCILGRKSCGKPAKYDKPRYKRRNRIEIMLGRLKGWRRITARYGRYPKVFLSG
jgi:transposase